MTQQATRKYLRIAVYALLVTSAGATFLLDERLWSAARLGSIPMWAPLIAPALFTVFVAVYTIDRWLLVRRRVSSIGRAALQVAFAIIFLSLLWPQQATQYRETVRVRRAEDYAVLLLRHHQADVRAAACELLGLRAQISEGAQVQAEPVGLVVEHTQFRDTDGVVDVEVHSQRSAEGLISDGSGGHVVSRHCCLGRREHQTDQSYRQ